MVVVIARPREPLSVGGRSRHIANIGSPYKDDAAGVRPPVISLTMLFLQDRELAKS